MGEKLYYEPEQRDAEAEINRLLIAADQQALEIIQSRREATEKLAQALLARETLTRDEVLKLVKGVSELDLAPVAEDLCLVEA
jgi:ATP-dependent Zn protease